MHANEGSTDASRRQLQFGTIHDVCYAKYQVPTRANVAFPEIHRYIQVHVMVLKSQKTVIISAAVTCLKVPALSSDLPTKVRNPSQ